MELAICRLAAAPSSESEPGQARSARSAAGIQHTADTAKTTPGRSQSGSRLPTAHSTSPASSDCTSSSSETGSAWESEAHTAAGYRLSAAVSTGL